MDQEVRTIRYFGLPVIITRSSLVASGALVVVIAIIASLITTMTPLDALIVGLLATLIHWVSEISHQYGHHLAARRIGKPAQSVRLWWFLSRTVYPRDEGRLSALQHMQRALGGPLMSALIGLACGLLMTWWWSLGGVLRFLITFAAIENMVIFGLGAFVPLTIGDTFRTDGATILQYYKQQKKDAQ